MRKVRFLLLLVLVLLLSGCSIVSWESGFEDDYTINDDGTLTTTEGIILDAKGNVLDDNGFELDKDGKVIYPEDPLDTPLVCETGFVEVDGVCVIIDETFECETGFYYDDGDCVMDSETLVCETGFYEQEDLCYPNVSSDNPYADIWNHRTHYKYELNGTYEGFSNLVLYIVWHKYPGTYIGDFTMIYSGEDGETHMIEGIFDIAFVDLHGLREDPFYSDPSYLWVLRIDDDGNAEVEEVSYYIDHEDGSTEYFYKGVPLLKLDLVDYIYVEQP